MLSTPEKDNLYQIIRATIGDDISIKQVKNSFNESTVSIVEDMIKANATCNRNMKELLVELIGAGSVLSKGWLKAVLKKSKSSLKKQRYMAMLALRAQNPVGRAQL